MARTSQQRGRRAGLIAISALVAAAGCSDAGGTGGGGHGAAAGQGGAGAQGGGGGAPGAGGNGAGGAGGTSAGAGGGAVSCGAADVAAAPPSCSAGGPGAGSDCGPGGSASCCENHLVPCGTHFRTYDGQTFNVDDYPATLSDLRLDTYEITVGRFRAFVSAGKGTLAAPPDAGDGAHPKIPGSGWDPAWNENLAQSAQDLIDSLHCNVQSTWTDTPGPNERLPVNCVSWFEAFAFCAWDGGRLPTEAEWDRAAAGGDEQREYPWGSGIDDTHAVYGCIGGQCPPGFLPDVGSRSPQGDGRWGQADMAGSVAEWMLDWFFVEFQSTQPCVDCASVTAGTARSIRSGSYVLGPGALRTAERFSAFPVANETLKRDVTIGARCARQP